MGVIVTSLVTVAVAGGCTPEGATPIESATESSPAAPEGESFAYITGFNGVELEFDPAEMFFGDEAASAATDDGIENGAPNGVHVRNSERDTMRVSTVSDLEISLIANQTIATRSITAPEFAEMYSQGLPSDWVYGDIAQLPCVITIRDGNVMSVVEQYVP